MSLAELHDERAHSVAVRAAISISLAVSVLLGCGSSGFEPSELTEFPGDQPIVRSPQAPAIASSDPVPAPPPEPVDTGPADLAKVCAHWSEVMYPPGSERAEEEEACKFVLEAESTGPGWAEVSGCIMAGRDPEALGECILPKQISFFDLFLTEQEVPAGMMHLQEPNPTPNEQLGFVFGFSPWMNPNQNATMTAFFDMRYVFDTDAEAKAFLAADPDGAVSEGWPEIFDAQKIVEDCRVWGGERNGTVAYMYAFRYGSIVVKNFAKQGESAPSPLTPTMMIPYEKKILAKLEGLF